MKRNKFRDFDPSYVALKVLCSPCNRFPPRCFTEETIVSPINNYLRARHRDQGPPKDKPMVVSRKESDLRHLVGCGNQRACSRLFIGSLISSPVLHLLAFSPLIRQILRVLTGEIALCTQHHYHLILIDLPCRLASKSFFFTSPS